MAPCGAHKMASGAALEDRIRTRAERARGSAPIGTDPGARPASRIGCPSACVRSSTSTPSCPKTASRGWTCSVRPSPSRCGRRPSASATAGRVPRTDVQPPRWAPQPLRMVTQPVRADHPGATSIPRIFVHCTAKPEGWFFGLGLVIAARAERARRAGWVCHELPTDHLPMLTARAVRADLLDRAAAELPVGEAARRLAGAPRPMRSLTRRATRRADIEADLTPPAPCELRV
jgi:hypothetical protein